ncbi:MAG: MBL fold metallo-hydrolase [Candidatus Bathyarchaeia archaeon]
MVMGFMEKILEAKVAPRELAIFWLGQNSFIFKTSKETLIGLDLYLSRVYASERHIHPDPPMRPEEVIVDYVFSTHDHLDHLDPYTVPGILKRSPKAIFIGTPEGRDHYVRLGVPPSQAIGMEADETLRLKDFRVTAFYSVDPKEGFGTTHYGYLFFFEACKVYNMGDSSPGMAKEPETILKPVAEEKPDIAMFPIVGDYPGRRPEQALGFARIVRPKIVIPTHYGCFIGRDADPREFVGLFKDIPDVKPVIIEYMGSYIYRP